MLENVKTTNDMPPLQTPVSQETNTVPNPFANPGTPGGFMGRDPNELSFLFNKDSGNLEIVGKESLNQPPTQVQETQKTQEPPKQEEPKSGDSYEERFSRIEQGMAMIGSFFEGLKNGQVNLNPQNGQSTQQPETVDYSGIDMQDANQVAAMFRDIASREIKSQLQPILTKQDQLGVESTYHRAASEYGDEFKQALPTIKALAEAGILNSDPSKIDFVKIFFALKQAGALKSNSARSDSTIQSVNGSGNGKPQTAQELVQRAAALSTESPGVQRNIVNNDDEPVKTVDDAFNKAWNQLFNAGR